MRAAVRPFKRGHSLREQTHFGDSRGVAESHVLVSCHLLQEVHELRAEGESGSPGRTISGVFYINKATFEMQERADFHNQLRANTKKKISAHYTDSRKVFASLYLHSQICQRCPHLAAERAKDTAVGESFIKLHSWNTTKLRWQH